MLKDTIKTDMINYMKEKNKEAVSVIRMLNSAIKNKEIETKSDLDDSQIISIINKEIKQYKDSLTFNIENDRKEEIEKINHAIDLLTGYLPKQVSDEEARQIIENILSLNKITVKNQKGLAMKLAMGQLKGKCDGSKINKFVDEYLR